MDDRSLAELRVLRLRAYGPDADIDDDPAALARLRELEQPAAGADTAHLPALVATDVVTDAAVPDPIGTDPAPSTVAARNPRRRTPWTRWRIAAWWAASLAVVTVVSAAVATAVDVPTSSVPGAHYYASIPVDDAFTVPDFLGGFAGVRGFQDYLGFTAVALDEDYDGVGVEHCIVLVTTSGLSESANGFQGARAWGCGAAPFPVAASITVGDGSPDALRRTFSDGTALQFVLAGDVVNVFRVAPSAAPASTP